MGSDWKKLKIAYMMVGETHSFVLGTTRTNFASVLPERYHVIDYTHPNEGSRSPYFTYRAIDGKLLSYEEFMEQQRARSGEQ